MAGDLGATESLGETPQYIDRAFGTTATAAA
jgi:hypothetical protein